MRIIALAAVALVCVLANASVAVAESPNTPSRSNLARAARGDALRATARKWETLVGLSRARTRWSTASRPGYRFWQQRARAVARLAASPPHKRGWLCIHRFEGSWSDSGDPYWGGLQMDRGFMATYAPRSLLRRGYANSWTPLEQMWVAERAHRSGRGYGPWPNTARYCGLL